MSRFVSCPSRVRSVNLGHATVVLNVRSGGVATLLGWPHRLWSALASTSDPAAVRLGDVDPVQVHQMVRRWCVDGLLEATATPRPWSVPVGRTTEPSWGTQEVAAALTSTDSCSIPHTLLAATALAVILVVRGAGRRRRAFARLIRLLETVTRRRGRQADRRAAEEALHSVRRVAGVLPARVACLEESAAAVLVLAATGRRAVWCHGVAADPIRLHAWLTAGSQPVAEPASTDRYTPLIQIPRDSVEAKNGG
jgi:hypothetical protein